jgi:hypothetical protein
MDCFGALVDAGDDVFTYHSTIGGLRSVMPQLADSVTSLALTSLNGTQIVQNQY